MGARGKRARVSVGSFGHIGVGVGHIRVFGGRRLLRKCGGGGPRRKRSSRRWRGKLAWVNEVMSGGEGSDCDRNAAGGERSPSSGTVQNVCVGTLEDRFKEPVRIVVKMIESRL